MRRMWSLENAQKEFLTDANNDLKVSEQVKNLL